MKGPSTEAILIVVLGLGAVLAHYTTKTRRLREAEEAARRAIEREREHEIPPEPVFPIPPEPITDA